MASTCLKCEGELPRQVLWKGLKSTNPFGAVAKVEIYCPQCRQLLRITPKSAATILGLACLPIVPITLWIIFFLPRPRVDMDITTILLLLVLYPLMCFALQIVLYPRLARFRKKPRPHYSIRG